MEDEFDLILFMQQRRLTMVTPGKLVVVYGKSGAKSASNIDLEKRSVTTTQSIIELGPEVK
jgi:hypothetical protein